MASLYANEESGTDGVTLPEIDSKPLIMKDNYPSHNKLVNRGGKKVFPVIRKSSTSTDNSDTLKQMEKGFVLDGVVLSRLSNDDAKRTNPSINIGIPQYIAQKDVHSNAYFTSKALPKRIPSDSMMGSTKDKFFKSTEATKYLEDRILKGTSYTRRIYGGHTTIPTNRAQDGYNGPEGYRRNTFELRYQRSEFDYIDEFDNPKQNVHQLRTKSAPATIKQLRQRSASAYRAHPGRNTASAFHKAQRIQSAICGPVDGNTKVTTGPTYSAKSTF